jgi:hypothetical protein
MTRTIRSLSVAALVLIALTVMAGPALAGTRSEGAVRAWYGEDPVFGSPNCDDPGHLYVYELGEGVDSVYGPFDLIQPVCLDPTYALFSNPPTHWYVYNLTATMIFKTNPEDTLTIVADDHIQNIDLEACLGMPDKGVVWGWIVGGTGRFEGAQGFARFNYGSPQTSICGIPGDIMEWYTMYIEGPKR